MIRSSNRSKPSQQMSKEKKIEILNKDNDNDNNQNNKHRVEEV